MNEYTEIATNFEDFLNLIKKNIDGYNERK